MGRAQPVDQRRVAATRVGTKLAIASGRALQVRRIKRSACPHSDSCLANPPPSEILPRASGMFSTPGRARMNMINGTNRCTHMLVGWYGLAYLVVAKLIAYSRLFYRNGSRTTRMYSPPQHSPLRRLRTLVERHNLFSKCEISVSFIECTYMFPQITTAYHTTSDTS